MLGTVDGIWSQLTPTTLYGVRAPSQVPDVAPGRMVGPGIERSAGASMIDDATAPPWHPNNPLFWLGGLLAVTFGLAAFSTSFRVGTVRAGVSAGKK